MKFEFAKYTEITDLALRVNPSLSEQGYVRFFICPDVNDYWLCRLLKGYDDEYNGDVDSYLLERERIAKSFRGEKCTVDIVKRIIEEDDGGNWDYKQSYNPDELIEMIDNGYGINDLNEDFIYP